MQIESDIAQHFINESHIRQLADHLYASFEIPERSVIELEQMYQQSNGHEADFKIVLTKAWNEVFQYRKLNLNTTKQCHDDHMPLTKLANKRIINNLQQEIITFDDLAVQCAMPKGDLQNHITWCIKRFASFTDYINHGQYFSRFKNAIYIQYNMLAIPVTIFHCDKQAVYMVCCNVSTRRRKHKTPRNDTELLWMETSLDSHFKLTAGYIAAPLQCLFIIKDAKSNIEELHALVQTFATGLICHTTSIVTGGVWHR